MNSPKTELTWSIAEIVDIWLRENGYDGVVLPGVCCCEVGDLTESCLGGARCYAGHKRHCVFCPDKDKECSIRDWNLDWCIIPETSGNLPNLDEVERKSDDAGVE